jgi:hypothetical protein
MDMYVLKNGEILGPFKGEELVMQVEAGKFTVDDLAQPEGAAYWTPLRKLLDVQEEAPSGVLGGMRAYLPALRREVVAAFETRSWQTALLCLAAGTFFFLLSLWPALLWLPWFAAAFVASMVLIRAGQQRRGIVICVVSAFLPLTLALLVSSSRRAASQSVGDLAVQPEPAPVLSAAPPSDGADSAATPALETEPAPSVAPVAPVAISAPTPAAESPLPAATPPPKAIRALPIHAAAPSPPPMPAELPAEPSKPAAPAVAPDTASADRGGLLGLKDRLVGMLPKRQEPGAPNASPEMPPPEQPGAADPSSLNAKPGTSPGDPAAPRPAPSLDPAAAQLVREHRNSLVFIEDAATGSGSGFLCKAGEKTFLFTNVHVVAGMTAPKFTRLDRSPLAPGSAAAAVGHDILRFEVPAQAGDAPRPLELLTSLENEAAIGDEVLVLGNSEGANVILPLVGKISGLGPNLVEVTAEFVPGNSGSPIIHKKSGKVIGIATYAIKRDMEWLSEKATEEQKATKIRRFGYRVDSVQTWQPVRWSAFANDAAAMKGINQLTGALARVLDDIRDDGLITAGRHQNPAIRRSVDGFVQSISNKTVSSPDRLRIKQNFLANMRTASQAIWQTLAARSGMTISAEPSPMRRKSASSSARFSISSCRASDS